MTRPERAISTPSRLRRRSLVGLGILASIAAFVGWGDRSAATEHPIATERVLVVNVAGPVTVTGGDTVTTATVEVGESWLFARPEISVDVVEGRTVVRARCPGRGPCRAAIDVEVGAGAELVVVASGAVTVRRFDGSLSALSSESEVALGPVSGSVRAVAAGRIDGWGLLVDEVDVSSAAAVELEFADIPSSVVIDGESDVRLRLPDEDYLVVADSGGIVTSGLSEDDGAGSRLVISAGGDIDLEAG